MRRLFKVLGVENKEKGSSISICQFNILASNLASVKHFPYVRPEILAWERRSVILTEEIKRLSCDILCFQELSNYWTFFKPELGKIGYDSVYLGRPSLHFSEWSGDQKKDGCGVFYRQEKFELINERSVHFHDVYDRVALIVVLREKSIGRVLIVACTHLYWNAAKLEDQLKELKEVEDAISLLMDNTAEELKIPGMTIPVFVCGDLNNGPDSDIYRYMAHQFLRKRGIVMRSAYDTYTHLLRSHTSPFHPSSPLSPGRLVALSSPPSAATTISSSTSPPTSRASSTASTSSSSTEVSDASLLSPVSSPISHPHYRTHTPPALISPPPLQPTSEYPTFPDSSTSTSASGSASGLTSASPTTSPPTTTTTIITDAVTAPSPTPYSLPRHSSSLMRAVSLPNVLHDTSPTNAQNASPSPTSPFSFSYTPSFPSRTLAKPIQTASKEYPSAASVQRRSHNRAPIVEARTGEKTLGYKHGSDSPYGGDFEPSHTTLNYKRAWTIDYIWHSTALAPLEKDREQDLEETLGKVHPRLTAVLEVPSEDTLRSEDGPPGWIYQEQHEGTSLDPAKNNNGIPNSTFGSDHVPLMGCFHLQDISHLHFPSDSLPSTHATPSTDEDPVTRLVILPSGTSGSKS